jgi:hypothetical protein
MSNYAAGAAMKKGTPMNEVPDIPFFGNDPETDDIYHDVYIQLLGNQLQFGAVSDDSAVESDSYLGQVVRSFVMQHNLVHEVVMRMSPVKGHMWASVEFASSPPAYPLGRIDGVSAYCIYHDMSRRSGFRNTVVAIRAPQLNVMLQANSRRLQDNETQIGSSHADLIDDVRRLMHRHFPGIDVGDVPF